MDAAPVGTNHGSRGYQPAASTIRRAACGLRSMDQNEFVVVLGAYCGRKGLDANVLSGTFIDASQVPGGSKAQEDRIRELAEVLKRKDAELELAKRPQASPLTNQSIDDLAKQALRYGWVNLMVGAMKGLRDVLLNTEDWSKDVFVQKMWCLLHMEIHVQKTLAHW